MVSLRNIFHKKHSLPKIDFFKLVLLVSALVVAFSTFYYLMIFIPGKEKARTDWEREQAVSDAAKESVEESDRQFNQRMLEACLTDAESSYTSYWNKECKGQGLSKDCSLPGYLADNASDFRKEIKNDCFKQYPASSR